PCVLLVEVDPRAARFHLAANGGRNAPPYAFDLGEILGNRADLSVLFDKLTYQIVERFQHALMDLNVPIPMRHDVVTGARLRFSTGGEFVLLALRSDVIDMHLNLVLFAPFVAELGERVVCSGHPMVPATQA